MKIALTVGHSLLKNGCYTSADGRNNGGCNEYIWCKAFSKQLTNKLKAYGHDVTCIICPEKQFTSYKQEKDYKLNFINKGNYDLVIELHLNGASPSAEGTTINQILGKGMLIKFKSSSLLFLRIGVLHIVQIYIC